MNEDNIIPLAKSDKSFNDALTDVLRCGTQQLLMQAVEAKVQAFLTDHQDKMLTNGRHQIIRNGYLPERSIQTGIGTMYRGHETGVGVVSSLTHYCYHRI